jgi:hypothetical protein
MRRRKIRDEADARACLAAVRAAGGDAVAWARAHGVDARSLNCWRVNFDRRARAPKDGALALVELVPSPPVHTSGRYVLDFGVARLEFDDACSADTLRRVVAAVVGC